MKIVMTVLALTISFSAATSSAEQPKHAAGCTQEQIAKKTCIPTREAGAPTLSESVAQQVRAIQKKYFDYLRAKKLQEDRMTPEERLAAEQQAQM